MITVICSKCGELIESTRRSVVQPFVCEQCDAEKAFDAYIASVKLATPTREKELADKRLELDQQEVDAFYDAMAPKEPKCETESLTDEFASVENTTRLIEDLDAQLVEALKERDRLKRENERLQEKVADYSQHISAGRETIKEWNEQSQLWRNTRDAAIRSRDFYKDEADAFHSLLMQERNRSLWSILRERVGF